MSRAAVAEFTGTAFGVPTGTVVGQHVEAHVGEVADAGGGEGPPEGVGPAPRAQERRLPAVAEQPERRVDKARTPLCTAVRQRHAGGGTAGAPSRRSALAPALLGDAGVRRRQPAAAGDGRPPDPGARSRRCRHPTRALRDRRVGRQSCAPLNRIAAANSARSTLCRPQPICHFEGSRRSREISCVRSVGSRCARDFSAPCAHAHSGRNDRVGWTRGSADTPYPDTP